MTMPQESGYSIPFPAIPESTKTKYSIGSLFLRPFGMFENDLEIDFNQKLHPYLLTQILECCARDNDGNKPAHSFFWDLTVGKRIECLMTIATSGGISELPIHLRCMSEACRESMEIEVSLEEVADLQRQSDETDPFMIQMDARKLWFRKPTGGDQLEWLKALFQDEEAAIKGIIRTLLCNDDIEISIPNEWITPMNQAMEEFDPLVNLRPTIHCPHCGHESHHPVDLQERLFYVLKKAQLNLLQTIHRLAAHYHWSEQQILAIPAWRRSYYLALIEKEET